MDKELQEYLNSFNEQFPQEDNNSGWFKILPDTKVSVRVLSFPVPYPSHYVKSEGKGYILVGADKGCPFSGVVKPNIKHLCWVLDNESGAVKLYNMPTSVKKEIARLQEEEEYAFETYPMPYDIKIERTGDNMETRYAVMPARQNSDIDSAVLEDVSSRKSPLEIIQSMKDKRIQELNG